MTVFAIHSEAGVLFSNTAKPHGGFGCWLIYEGNSVVVSALSVVALFMREASVFGPVYAIRVSVPFLVLQPSC